MTKKKVSSKPVTNNESTLALEQLITRTFQEEVAKQVRELLAQSAMDPRSYLMKSIEKSLNEVPTEEPEPKDPNHFQKMNLDDDEIRVGAAVISKVASKLNPKDHSLNTWAVIIDGKKFPPKVIYRKAFESDGFKVDWHFNTYKTLSWLTHHGFKVVRV